MTIVAAVKSKASHALPLQELVEQLNLLEDSQGIETVAIHLLGNLNDLPDRLSRERSTKEASMLTFDPTFLPIEVVEAKQLIGLT